MLNFFVFTNNQTKYVVFVKTARLYFVITKGIINQDQNQDQDQSQGPLIDQKLDVEGDDIRIQQMILIQVLHHNLDQGLGHQALDGVGVLTLTLLTGPGTGGHLIEEDEDGLHLAVGLALLHVIG